MNSLMRCPVCSKTHSDTCQLTDARCYRCRWEAAHRFESPRPKQDEPRPAMIGDICCWRALNLPGPDSIEEMKVVYVGAYATIRDRMEVKISTLPYQYRVEMPRNDALQAMRAESIELRKDLAKLQSALREEKEMRGVFERTCVRRLEIINNLRNETKVNGEYIVLQATRLKAARNELRRMYTASGLHVPNDDELDL